MTNNTDLTIEIKGEILMIYIGLIVHSFLVIYSFYIGYISLFGFLTIFPFGFIATVGIMGGRLFYFEVTKDIFIVKSRLWWWYYKEIEVDNIRKIDIICRISGNKTLKVNNKNVYVCNSYSRTDLEKYAQFLRNLGILVNCNCI